MKINESRMLFTVFASGAFAAAFIAGCGIASNSEKTTARERSVATTQTASDGPLAAIFGPTPHKAGAQLWAENCTRCHYIRPADAYSSVQWELLLHHMRSRANLTGREEREILKFLKAGSGIDSDQ